MSIIIQFNTKPTSKWFNAKFPKIIIKVKLNYTKGIFFLANNYRVISVKIFLKYITFKTKQKPTSNCHSFE